MTDPYRAFLESKIISAPESVTVHHGDSREILKTLGDCSIDACVTDPPYALVSIGKRFGADNAAAAKVGKTGAYARASAGFMGKRWDTGETAFDPDFWREVWRVLKPGAHLVAFGGTRTYHRLTCAIEDAGFEIRDQIAWLYGSGFPKSHSIGKALDKAAGATRRPTGVVRRASIQRNGAPEGAFASHPEETKRVEVTAPATDAAAAWEEWGTALKPALEPICLARKPLSEGTIAANVLRWGTGALNIGACRIGSEGGTKGVDFKGRWEGVANGVGARNGIAEIDAGRWPANVCHDGSDAVLDAFPESDGQSGVVTGEEPSSPFANVYGDMPNRSGRAEPRGDSGSAARFFYGAKADAEDRLGSKHPTVKPVSLMRWLCRLVTPLHGVVLDPFAGSGTTGLAASAAGFGAILIEREAEYIADIERRLAWARGEGRLTAQEMARRIDSPADHGPLFADHGPLFAEPSRTRCDATSTECSQTKAHWADGIEAVRP